MLVQIQHAFTAYLACVSLVVLAVKTLAGNGEVITRVSTASQMNWVEQVAEYFNVTSIVVWSSNGEMQNTERMGRLGMLRGGKLELNQVSGVPASFLGLLDCMKDIILARLFRQSGALPCNSEGTVEQRHAATVVRMKLPTDRTLPLAVGDKGPGALQLGSHMSSAAQTRRFIPL